MSSQAKPAFTADDLVTRARTAMDALNADTSRLGSFPGATLDVCLAIEILRKHLETSKTTYGGAVEMVQMKAGGKTVFVIACSGAPDGLDACLGTAQLQTLEGLIQGRLGNPCSLVYADSAYEFYLPMNADFLKLFDGVTKGFNPPTKWLAFKDISVKLDKLQNEIEKKVMAPNQEALSKGYRKEHELEARQTAPGSLRTSVIKDIATCALALHMNACGDEQEKIRAYFELTLLYLELHSMIIAQHWDKDAAWVKGFTACAAALARKTQDTPVDLTPYYDGLDDEARKAFTKYVEMKKSSLFCAEPRAFASISKRVFDVKGVSASGIVSQACIWSPGGGRDCPDEYIVKGTMHGKWCYMWPCKSCKARSSFMMAGLTIVSEGKRKSFEV